jgi:hypothetical protein
VLFIDTSVAVRLGFRFDRPPFTTLVERRKRGQVFLAIPSITLAEWTSHGESLVLASMQQVAQARKKTEVLVQLGLPGGSGLSEHVDDEAAMSAIKQTIQSFVAENSLNPALLSFNPYDAEEVLRWYYNTQPPFTDKRDKCQFPDAFVVSTLCEWARRNHIALRVVTGDAAMRLAFERHGNHQVYDSLDQVLADIAREVDPLYEETAQIVRSYENDLRNHVAWCIGRLSLATIEPYTAKISAIDELDLGTDITFVSQDAPNSIFATLSIRALARVRYEVCRAAAAPSSVESLSGATYPDSTSGTTTIEPRLSAQVQIPVGSERAFIMPLSILPESDLPIQVPLPQAT